MQIPIRLTGDERLCLHNDENMGVMGKKIMHSNKYTEPLQTILYIAKVLEGFQPKTQNGLFLDFAHKTRLSTAVYFHGVMFSTRCVFPVITKTTIQM